MRRRFKSADNPPKILNSAGNITQHQRLNDDDRFADRLLISCNMLSGTCRDAKNVNDLRSLVHFQDYVIKDKKVASPDNEADPLPNAGRVTLSKKYRTARNPNSDTPKTSEYAFFKKLKKNIGHSNSDLLHRGSRLSKITQPSNCISDTRSTYNVLKCPNKDVKIPIQVEKEHQTNECQSFSPVDGVIGISKEAKLKYFSPPTVVTPVYSNLLLSPLAGPSHNSGSQYSGNGIFAAKRQKLCQRANKLFLDVQKLNSERFDLVSALLRRLFPGRNEDEDFWDSQVRKGEIASTSSLANAKPDHAKTQPPSRHIEHVMAPEYWMSQSDCCPSNFWDSQVRKGEIASTSSLANAKPDHAKTRPPSRHIEHVMAPEYWMSQSDCCPSNFFGRPKERVPPELHYEDADNSQISNNKITISLWDQSDSLPSLSFDHHGLADFLPYRLHSADIPVSRGAQDLFLDWDFNEEKNDPVLAITTIRGNKLCSPIATSWHVDYQQQITEKKLDALALCSSSLFMNSGYSDVLPYSCSTSFHKKLFPTDICSKEFGTTLEHEEYAVARMDRFDLPLLCSSEEQDLLEDHNPENPFESSNAIIPYLSNHEKHHCDSDGLMPMALDTFGWKFLSAASSPLQKGLSTYNALILPHIEDSIGLTQEEIKNSLYDSNPREIAPQSVERALNSDIWFSCNSEVFSDKASGRSLLLDNSSWITSVEEISPDHSDEWTWS